MKKASGFNFNLNRVLRLFGFKKEGKKVGSIILVDRNGDTVINNSKNALDYHGGDVIYNKPCFIEWVHFHDDIGIHDIGRFDSFKYNNHGNHGILKRCDIGIPADDIDKFLSCGTKKSL